jgi:putative DNA primase/helicase
MSAATTMADVSTTLLNVPTLLKDLPNWIWWRLEKNKDGAETKVPYVAGSWNRHASSTDPSTWTTFEGAVDGAVLSSTQGIGFVIHGAAADKKIVGFDLDGCRNSKTGELSDWAQTLVYALESYTEVTPSGTGIRIWVVGKLPDGARVFNVDPAAGFGHKVKIEVFDHARYFTITGQIYDALTPTEIAPRNLSEAYKICRDIQAQFPVAASPKNGQPDQNLGAGTGAEIVRTNPGSGSIITDKLAEKVQLFMHGHIVPGSKPFVISNDQGDSLTYPSQSEADMALCTLLAIKGLDPAQIDVQFRQSALYRDKWERHDYRKDTIQKAIKSSETSRNESILVLSAPALTGTATSLSEIDEDSEAAIPGFDPSVMNGIYGDFVELVTRGTTLNPQFAYAIAKTVVGIRMAGKVKFEDLDVEPRYYTALIGKTGSGKGETWRRTYQILKVPGLIGGCGFKIVNDLDSGAGLKDLFFPSSKMESEEVAVFVPQPVLCFIDEVTTIGHKSAETRNPGIVDELITLANSTSISRNLAKRSGGSRSTDQARLALVMGGQDGSVYMKAFAGRTQLGMYDRLYPEYGFPVEVGDLPPIDAASGMALMHKFNSLGYSGTMTMSPEAKTLLDECWSSQSPETRKKARWRSNLKLDAYMSAFGRGLKVVEAEDARVAIKIFERQLIIRRVCFTTEVPDRVGYYLGLIKRITERMIKQLAAGAVPGHVAKSRRDYERLTNAARDNEEHIFEKAWQIHSRVHLQPVTIVKSNGHQYQKFLPVPEE